MSRVVQASLVFAVCCFAVQSVTAYAQDDQSPADQASVLFDDTTSTTAPMTRSLDERLKALEDEGAQTSQALDDHSQRIGKIESSMRSAKEKEEQKKSEDAKKDKKWFEKIGIRGYTQVRINEAFEDDNTEAPAQYVGDGSIADNNNFLIRRARLILFGDINEHAYLYFQSDFASNVPGSPDAYQYAQIKDAYVDVFIDKEKEFRFRIGQSKIPYGWEDLQSSQNRIPLDRNDALDSAVRNERDLGAFFFYTPRDVQDLFKEILDSGLKGSGNYGMFGIGAYNGQGGALREQNNNLHVFSRLALPFYLNDEQIVEFGVQGYIGKYSVLSSAISPLGIGPAVRPFGTIETDGRDGILDKRLAWTFVYYPQPFGFQSEWTIGRGPALNDAQTEVIDRALYGGYAMAMYRWKGKTQELLPFVRWNYYKGGYKTERNAPYCEIKEWEAGAEWQINKALEFVTMYTITDRTNTTAFSTANTRSYDQFKGGILRFQLQFNY